MSKELPLITESSSLVESSIFVPVEATQAEILEQLTPEEQRDRLQLELAADQGFYQAGKALAQIRERRLYRSTHTTFALYCQDKFGFSRRKIDYLITAASVVKNLQQTRTIRSHDRLNEQNEFNENSSTIFANILPTKVEQTKALASLKPDEQRQVWNQAVEKVNGKVPTGQLVQEIAKQFQKKSLALVQHDWQVDDIFTLNGLEGKDKKYNRCWAIAVELTDFAVIVDVHDATITVKPENLNKIDSPYVKRQLRQTLRRIKQLHEVGSLDRGADNVLKDLIKHIALTPVEEDLLSWLENYYKGYGHKSRS